MLYTFQANQLTALVVVKRPPIKQIMHFAILCLLVRHLTEFSHVLGKNALYEQIW